MPNEEHVMTTTNDYLAEIYRSQKKQERFHLTRLLVQIATSAAVLALLAVLASRIVPMVTPVIEQIDEVTITVNELAATVNGLARNTNTLITELNAADLGGTVEQARDAISTASRSMQTAVDEISKVDFAALNTSVTALAAVVDAIAGIFGG